MTAWWIAGALLLGACSGGAPVESKVDGAQPGEAAAAIGDPAQAVDAPAAGEAAAAPAAGSAGSADPADPAGAANLANPAAAPVAGDPAAAPAAPDGAKVDPAKVDPKAPATPAAPASPSPTTPAPATTTPATTTPAAATPAGDGVAASDPPAARGPTSYKLDPGSSWIYAVLKYDRNTLIKGHDHVIKASTFDGSVVWSPSDASACKVQISFSASALAVDPPGARARAGLEGDTPEGDLPKIKENMLSKTQINASAFPTISYTSTSCSGTAGKVTVNGNLTIHGVSKPVTITMDVTEDGSAFKAKGSTSITHRMFGFDPFVAALGALKNDDSLKLVVDVRGTAR